jgi:hypothetical protein
LILLQVGGWRQFNLLFVIHPARPRWLRLIESGLVGLLLAEMGLGLFFDLFLDHELR